MSVEAPEAVDSVRSAGESIRSIVDDLRESAAVESVYGEPIESHGKTVIPVARIAYGFGGGFGRGGEEDEESGEGAGGGGGASAKPVGVVEVTDGETRFVRFGQRRRLGLALLGGVILGFLFGRGRSRE